MKQKHAALTVLRANNWSLFSMKWPIEKLQNIADMNIRDHSLLWHLFSPYKIEKNKHFVGTMYY